MDTSDIECRLVRSELQLGLALSDLVGAARDVSNLLLRDRVEQCERDIADLKRRGS
jgi:hypothetical protein